MFPAWEALGGTGEVIGFFIFWVANLAVVIRGSESIKQLEALAAPERVSLVPGNHDRYVAADWDRTIGRWRAFIAMELGVSVEDVAGTVLGGHGLPTSSREAIEAGATALGDATRSGRSAAGAGSALRSTFPLGVRGRVSRKTTAAGIM